MSLTIQQRCGVPFTVHDTSIELTGTFVNRLINRNQAADFPQLKAHITIAYSSIMDNAQWTDCDTPTWCLFIPNKPFSKCYF
jgi:hypothetical protein